MNKNKRNYKQEYETFHGTKEQIQRRSDRNRARRKLEETGRVKPGDGKDVHHKDGNTGNNSSDNLSVTTPAYNRGEANKK